MVILLFLKSGGKAALLAAIFLACAHICTAQSVAPTPKTAGKPAKEKKISFDAVKPIDINGLKTLLKPNGKPLLINFWATWCDPCREEFPDLVEIDEEFKGKIVFITVSLDDFADINTYVPKFLDGIKAKMPAYLLHTPDESEAITMVSKNWSGNLPMTILFDADGAVAYERNGKIRPDILRENIRKLLPVDQPK